MMRSAYSGVKLLFILILVDASLVFSQTYSACNAEIQQYPLEYFDDYDLTRCKLFNPDHFRLFNEIQPPPPKAFQYGIVTIKLDIWNKTDDSYKANVTITFNYLDKQHIEGIWDLKWTWNEDEILLSTVGVKGTQHSYVSTGDDKCCLNNVTFEDLWPYAVHRDRLMVLHCCEDGLIAPWLKKDYLAESSRLFQISVGQANLKYRAPPKRVTLIREGLKHHCDVMTETIPARGYENTWRSKCHLYFDKPKELPEIPNKHD